MFEEGEKKKSERAQREREKARGSLSAAWFAEQNEVLIAQN